MPAGRYAGCVQHWTVAEKPMPFFGAIAVTNFKETDAAAITQWVDYYHLLGMDHLAIIDNNCKSAFIQSTADALKPSTTYGFVTHLTKYQCQPFNKTFVAPNLRFHALTTTLSIARRLSGTTLIFELNDDEFLMLGDPRGTLQSVAECFFSHRICMTQLAWRVFGSNGHYCQPPSLVSNFTRRAPLLHEVHTTTMYTAIVYARSHFLSEPFEKGKLLMTWNAMKRCRAGEHMTSAEHYCHVPCTDNWSSCGTFVTTLNPELLQPHDTCAQAAWA